ncbi:MAG: YlxR family protein [Clostridiales bacterium]|nr:YlxR family protein [Clostridiales bacterium]
MCVSCGEMRSKKELLRLVRTPEGEIELDLGGRKNGRGAYICKCKDCFDRLPKSGRRIEKAFGCALPEAVLLRLGEEFSHGEPELEGPLPAGPR